MKFEYKINKHENNCIVLNFPEKKKSISNVRSVGIIIRWEFIGRSCYTVQF